MSDLIPKLRAALAFDGKRVESAQDEVAHDSWTQDFFNGASWQYAQNKAIEAALIECVAAADTCRSEPGRFFTNWALVERALAKLTAVLDGEGV